MVHMYQVSRGWSDIPGHLNCWMKWHCPFCMERCGHEAVTYNARGDHTWDMTLRSATALQMVCTCGRMYSVMDGTRLDQFDLLSPTLYRREGDLMLAGHFIPPY